MSISLANDPKIRVWMAGEIEEPAALQIKNVASMDIVRPHVAVMPDAHWGIGATVGSVIPTVHAIIPAAVGVDIGCGMTAVKTSLLQSQLPESMTRIYKALEETIPVGSSTWLDGKLPEMAARLFLTIMPEYHNIVTKHPAIDGKNLTNQLGTLGGGNHFVEIDVDEDDYVWVMLHSGSRGPGNRIGRYFIEKAKEVCLRLGLTNKIPHADLSYLIEGEPLFVDYIKAVEWAQTFASYNRSIMMENILRVMHEHLPAFTEVGRRVSCHHNYVEREKHFNQWMWITRKGAINATDGLMGIIPGSMGGPSFIVKGKGNEASFRSSSHGAGRTMSRGFAKLNITMEQHAIDTEGVICRKDDSVLDESPRAYKNIDDVMKAQHELTEPVARLMPVLCLKG